MEILTLDALADALAPVIEQIRALRKPSAEDVLVPLIDVWAKTSRALRDDFILLADLSDISRGPKPDHVGAIFWCQSNSGFGGCESVHLADVELGEPPYFAAMSKSYSTPTRRRRTSKKQARPCS